MSAFTIDPPASLPVDYLSLSSLRLLMQCPEKWRRRYIDHEPEPPSGRMLLGSCAGSALAQHYGTQIESGAGLCAEALLDEFATEWDDRTGRENVDWGTDTRGALKDSGAGALKVYHARIAPSVTPVAIEREFHLSWPGVDWDLTGYIDLEDADGIVHDYKMTAKRLSQRDADADLQADVYLGARRAEGNPAAGFRFDTMVRNKTPVAEVVETQRTERQLDLLTGRVFGLAAEIAYRCESGNWTGAAPNTWFCSTCRYADCPLRLGSL
jgi:PD-(D/E)XK nuclease superfamily